MFKALQKEMRMRNKRYAVPDLHQIALKIMNDRLEGADELYCINPEAESVPPVLFVLGLPRSWTTLCVQLLTGNLDVTSVTNIAAKFWNAPVTGLILSQMLDRGKRDTSLQSDYGKTDDPFGPHEFSYFWHRWFKMDTVPYRAAEKSGEIDWQGFYRIFSNMTGVSGKPLVLKAMDVVYHLPKVLETIQRSICIYVERDLRQVASSIAKGRIDYYGDLDTWFSLYPPDYPVLVKRPWFEQVAGQVYSFWKMHEEQIRQVDEKRIIRFSYENVCRKPQVLLDQVVSRIDELFGYNIRQISQPHAELSPHHVSLETAIETPLLKSLHSLMSFHNCDAE